jgi:hypothetical protein
VMFYTYFTLFLLYVVIKKSEYYINLDPRIVAFLCHRRDKIQEHRFLKM